MTMRSAICSAALLLTAVGPSSAVGAVDSAEEAARLIQQGNPRGAAVTVRQALGTEPGDLLLRQTAASLLLLTGDVEGSSSVWKSLLEERPGDGLSLYGLGIASLQHGDRAKALQLIQDAAKRGDRATCLIAERYLESLNGAKGAGLGLAVPDAYASSAKALSGMAASRMGDVKRAMTEVSESLAALPGEPYYETPGVVMTFEATSPVRFGFNPLPTGNGLATRRGPSAPKGYSGVVTLSPDAAGSDVGFVVFKIDGNVSRIANTRPFELLWNTANAANGPHRVEIAVYDKQGNVVNTAEKVINTANADAPAPMTVESSRVEAVRSQLWQALTLRPSRHVLAYTAAEEAQKLGDQKSAISFLQIAAALEPAYRDTRLRLEGVFPQQAMPAVWRGESNTPVIALTFDDGPKPVLTDRLVELLTREHVPATFFVIGRHATAYPEIIKHIANAGFEIENHTYTHPNLTMLTPASVEAELLKTVASVYASTGRVMRYFRPPGGNTSNDVCRAAAKWGLTPCMWTVDADSLENGSPDKLVEYVVQKATPGAIILLHNGRQTTLNALPRIIAGLRQRGFTFETIEGLLSRRGQSAVIPAAAGRNRPIWSVN